MFSDDTSCVVQSARWREGMDPEGPGQAGDVGLCEPQEVQQSENQGPTPRLRQSPEHQQAG